MPVLRSLSVQFSGPRSSSPSHLPEAPACGWGRAIVFALIAVLMFFAPDLAAQERLKVELQAPDEVRPLLQRHLRLLNRHDIVLPEARGDRIALQRRTRREIANLLSTEGYFSPEVQLERSEAGKWVLIVTPGARATISEVTLSFEGHLSGAGPTRASRRTALETGWALRQGAPFRQGDWDSAKQALLDGVASRDYAAARIVASRADVDPENAQVRLFVTVNSGPPFFLGPLEIEGLERLPEDFVTRYASVREGDRFDQDKLLAFQGALQNAPQFASVIVDIERNPELAAAVPVKVRVTEANSRHLGLGAGYSSNTGLRADVNWRDVNFLGRGWELSTGMRLEQRSQSLFGDIFFPPALAGHRDSVGAMLENTDIENLKTTTAAIGANRSKVRGNIETTLSLRYQREDLEPLGGVESSSNALTANWIWVQRRVDDVFNPRRGYVLHGEFGGGADALLSDQDFFRSYGRIVRYQPIGDSDTLILRAELGATIADSRDGIPQDFLFRTGGSQTVRGYRFESLGVLDGSATVGGRYLATTSAEYVRWFRDPWGVVTFIDAGDAADEPDELDLRVGYGVGARWRSPAGPLALDLAWAHQNEHLRLHFAIAIAF